MTIINSGVQYNDFKGSVAADRADKISMRDFLVGVAFLLGCPTIGLAQTGGNVLMTCQASEGFSRYFKDEALGVNEPDWTEDAISSGRIEVVTEGEEWDIRFTDAARTTSYRSQGATVLFLGQTNGKFSFGVFHSSFIDTYTFDVANKEVLWTTHKRTGFLDKVAIYQAECN